VTLFSCVTTDAPIQRFLKVQIFCLICFYCGSQPISIASLMFAFPMLAFSHTSMFNVTRPASLLSLLVLRGLFAQLQPLWRAR
jgi:hypothetical protein